MNAQERANETRELNGFIGKAYRRADTAYSGNRCWIVNEAEESAVVVYEDDSDAVVSISNYPGRLATPND